MTPVRSYSGATDVGRVREHNEDALVMRPPLFAVADGLGGHQAGEVASRTAIQTLLEQAPRKADAKALGRAVRQANRSVMESAGKGQGRSGMGTTMTVVMREGLHLAVAHVGDSRAYLLRRHGLERITQDHSLVADMVRQGTLTEAEARVHPNRSVITRALGSDPNLAVDTFDVTAEPGDVLLLCTDGLHGMLTDAEIARILQTSDQPEEAVGRLVDAANAAGGHDNVTAVVVVIGPDEPLPPGAGRERSIGLWALVLALILAVVVFGALGVWGYARSRAFVIAENDRSLSIYRGLQGSFGDIRLRWFVRRVPLDIDLLDPVVEVRLHEGVAVDSLFAAERLAEKYREEAEIERLRREQESPPPPSEESSEGPLELPLPEPASP